MVGAVPTSHVLITRFAVRLSPESALPGRDWVEGRLGLLSRYCVPSLASQTRTDFTWMLLVDTSLADELTPRLLATIGSMPFAVTVVAHDPNDAECLRRAVLSATGVENRRLITTRLDSDDAISRDHVERIREVADPLPEPSSAVIVFTQGYELSAGRLYWRPFPRSPFASLVEPSGDDPVTIMAAEHEAVDELGRVIEEGGPAAWIQVIHDSNVLNRVRGIRVARRGRLGRFDIDDPTLYTRESLVPLIVGVPASWLRTVRDVLASPRNRAKLIDVVTGRRSA